MEENQEEREIELHSWEIQHMGDAPTDIDLQELLELIENLPTDKRLALVQKLLGERSGLSVILGSNNVVNNGLAIQFSDSAEQMSEKFKEVDSEVIETFMRALASWISRH